MANPPNPTNPNITTGALTGRVVADRYDFQKHITGESLRHDGYSLSLVPAVTISSVEYDDVHSAISQLANLITPPPPPDATSSVKGLVRLAGDLGGASTSALNPRVSGLQGIPINTLTPTTNQVLTYNGSSWGPADTTNIFVAGGDLDGSNSNQTVQSITGNGGLIRILPSNFRWEAEVISPLLFQNSTSSGSGQDFTISAQDTSAASQNGGSLKLLAGDGGAGGLSGSVFVNLGTNRMVQAAEVAASRRVLGLVGSGDLNTTKLPANTGDRVIYIEATSTPPTTGGALLYARSSGLWTKNQDGYDFQLGTNPNPYVWGNNAEGLVLEYRNKLTTTSGTASIAFAKSLLDTGFFSCTIKVEATILGRQSTAENASVHNLSRSYIVNSSSVATSIGSEISTSPVTTGGASGWTAPSITTSGSSLRVLTGANSATNIVWFVYVRLYVNAL
jgi:hypothetical protein